MRTHGFPLLAIALLTLTAALALGCGGKGGDTPTADAGKPAADGAPAAAAGGIKSCNDVTALSSCSEHEAKAFAILGEEFFKGVCELTNGTWSGDRCPTEGLVGRCDDGEGSVTMYYSSGDSAYTADTAKTACTEDLEGSWKAAE